MNRWAILISLAILVLAGCGGQSVKPDNKLQESVDQAVKNSQEARAAIKSAAETIMGAVTNIVNNVQNTFSSFKTDIKTDFEQVLETYQGSMKDEIGTFTGKMEKTIKSSTNSSWLMFGLFMISNVAGLLVVRMVLATKHSKTVEHVTRRYEEIKPLVKEKDPELYAKMKEIMMRDEPPEVRAHIMKLRAKNGGTT